MQRKADVVIVGLGAMGSATLYYLTQLNPEKTYIGIDQFQCPHSYGSSHGESRILRFAPAEGREYIPLVQRNFELIKHLSTACDDKFYITTSGLVISDDESPTSFMQQSLRLAKEYDIPHKIFSTQTLKHRYPCAVLSREQGYFETNMSVLKPEAIIRAQLNCAQQKGAECLFEQRMLQYKQCQDGQIIVKTDKESILTKQLILACGPWLTNLLPKTISQQLHCYRAVQVWFELADSDKKHYQIGQCPIMMREFFDSDEVLLLFPSMDGNTVKVVCWPKTQNILDATTTDSVRRQVSKDEIQLIFNKFVAPNFRGIAQSYTKACVCLYTVAPDHRFIIDTIPETHDNILYISACSGHGFKYASAIGEAIAKRMEGGNNVLSLFRRVD